MIWDLVVKVSVGYVAVTLFFYVLSLFVLQAGFVARFLAGYVCLMFCSLFGVFASIFLRVIGRVGSAQWATARAFKWACWLTMGVTFEVIDPKGTLGTVRPAVFIGNHQTELDVLMLGCVFPKRCSVTAKASLKNWPFLGWYMRLSGTVFIDRRNAKDARHAMQGAADEMQIRKQSVYIFPEGTRSYSKDPTLLPFKKGAFHLAVQAGVPIVPIVVANYSHIVWLKGLIFRSGRIPVKVLDPIETQGMTAADVDGLTQRTRELMYRELVTLSSEAQGRAIPLPAELR